MTHGEIGLEPGFEAEFYQGFESLGANCEFGLLQRHFGAEPLGLLRWPAITVPGLVTSLRNQFSELDDISNFKLFPGPSGDWDVATPNFSLHLYTKIGSVDEETLLKSAFRRTQFMRRSLLENLEEAEKIFVFKEWQFRMSEAELHSIFDAVRQYNKNVIFLGVRLSTGDTPPAGSVSELMEGLWSGYVESDAKISAANNVPVESWHKICCTVRASNPARSC